MLILPQLRFLKDTDFLVVVGCALVAYPQFYRAFLKGKAVLICYPKFDDMDSYIEIITAIFATRTSGALQSL
jgi:hypothetical protein